MRTAARDASTRAAAALRSGFRSTASATSAVSCGSPKVRIQFGTTAPLRCGPAQLPGIFARADSGMMSATNGGWRIAHPASTRLLAIARSRIQRRAFIISILVVSEQSGEMFDDEPVEFCRDADDDATEDLDRRNIIRVDRSLTASASSKEDVFILPLCEESHCDALFGCRYGRGVGEVAVDWKLALRRRPKDGIDLALDDAARIHLHKNFRFVAGFDVAQFVLSVECQQPRIVLLDEAHHGHCRELGRAYAGLQGKIGHAPVRWSNVDAALEVEFLLAQVGFGLENLRPSLRFRGVGGEEFAFKIAEVALCLLEVSPLPSPSRGKRRELLDALFRQVDSRGERRFFGRCAFELIFESTQGGLGGFHRRLERHRVDLEKDVAFLDRPVWLNRHLGNLAGYARNDRYHVVHRAHVISCRRGDVQKEEKNHHSHDGQRDDNELAGKIPRQPLEFKENEPDEEAVDAKQNDFHYAFPCLICASSSAARARSCSSSLMADSFPMGFSCESSTSVP